MSAAPELSPDDVAPAHELIEGVLKSAGQGGCVVIVTDTSQVDQRFAVNTMTTNGTRVSRSVTVIRMVESSGGTAVGIASQTGSGNVRDLLSASEEDAKRAAAAEDAAPLITGGISLDFEEAPVPTDPSVLGRGLEGLADAFGRAQGENRMIAGFAEHTMSTAYLGTSTGTRLRHVQPTGKLEVVARDKQGGRSAWRGVGTADFAGVDIPQIEKTLAKRLEWAKRKIELPAGRYQVILPPDAVADLVLMIGEAASGRAAEEGRSVFSAPGGGTKLGEILT
jgi:predicted Zn-dependent protease